MRTILTALLSALLIAMPSLARAETVKTETSPYEKAIESFKTGTSVYVDPTIAGNSIPSSQEENAPSEDMGISVAETRNRFFQGKNALPEEVKVAFLGEPVATGHDEPVTPESSAQKIREALGDVSVIVYNVDRNSYGVSTGDKSLDSRIQTALTKETEITGVAKSIQAHTQEAAKPVQAKKAQAQAQKDQEEKKAHTTLLFFLVGIGAVLVVVCLIVGAVIFSRKKKATVTPEN